jgi:hypothetical protein
MPLVVTHPLGVVSLAPGIAVLGSGIQLRDLAFDSPKPVAFSEALVRHFLGPGFGFRDFAFFSQRIGLLARRPRSKAPPPCFDARRPDFFSLAAAAMAATARFCSFFLDYRSRKADACCQSGEPWSLTLTTRLGDTSPRRSILVLMPWRPLSWRRR